MIFKERKGILRKKQKVINVKEIRLTPSIDKHDIEVKAKHAK